MHACAKQAHATWRCTMKVCATHATCNTGIWSIAVHNGGLCNTCTCNTGIWSIAVHNGGLCNACTCKTGTCNTGVQNEGLCNACMCKTSICNTEVHSGGSVQHMQRATQGCTIPGWWCLGAAWLQPTVAVCCCPGIAPFGTLQRCWGAIRTPPPPCTPPLHPPTTR